MHGQGFWDCPSYHMKDLDLDLRLFRAQHSKERREAVRTNNIEMHDKKFWLSVISVRQVGFRESFHKISEIRRGFVVI